ncbi:MAG: hypothetical protein L3J88_03375 [Gammaproteobacteria bacterium]|nr:hypothetical protein [Gammaproteobacteria bacterium]
MPGKTAVTADQPRPGGQHRLTKILALLAGLLAGGLALAAPQIVSVSPDQVQSNQPVTLTIETAHWQPQSHLALVPGGPFSSHRLELPTTPHTIASDGRRAYVARHGGWLQSIEFPPEAEARISAQLQIGDGEIRQLKIAHGHLLAAVDGRGVMLFDISLPTQIIHRWTYPTDTQVQDMQLGRDEAWLLLDNRYLERLRFGNSVPNEAERRWILPFTAHSFVLQGDTALVTGAEGIASLDLSTPSATIFDRQTTRGTSRRVQLVAGLALLEDGPGGLVVFDARDPRQLRWLGSHAKRGPIRGLSASADRAWVGIGERTLLSIALGNPTLPTAGDALRLDAPLVDLAAHGDIVFAATTRGVQRLDFGTPTVADISPEGINLGGSRRGVIRDNILYVADWFSGLHLYDIRDPANPRHLGNYHTPGSSKGVTLYGDYALVGDDDRGLQIINISDPRQPRWVSELSWESDISTLGLAYTMKRIGSTLYLADHRGGFQIIDLSDIEHPRILGALDTSGKSWAIDVSGHTAFIADDDGGLLIVDVSDPAQIGLVGRFNPGGHVEDVVVRDDLAYLALFDNGLFIVDVSDPANPRPLAHLAIPGNARGITLVDNLAYISGWESGLQIVDISHPQAPQIIGHFDTDGAAWGTAVQGNTAYVLDWWGGIKVLDISNPARPAAIARYQARGTLQQLRSTGHYIFAASGIGGLQVFDIHNPLNPIWTSGADLPGEALDLWLEEGHTYVASGDAGVTVIDTLDPFYARVIGQLDTPGAAWLIRARNGYLFIADRHAGLLVVDAREPRHPRILSRQPMTITDLWVDDDSLLVATPEGLQQLTLDTAGRLTPVSHFSTPGVQKIRSQAGLVAISLSDDTVQLLRREANGFIPLGRFQAHEAVLDLQLDGGQLFILGARSGLMAVDISQPDTPRLTTLYPATAHHRNLLLSGNAAFLGGERHLNSVALLPDIRFTTPSNKPARLQLPNGLPSGRYHLLTFDNDGRQHLLPNAFTVRFGIPGQKRFNLETLRQLMKKPLVSDN